jgi:hypothetical protein
MSRSSSGFVVALALGAFGLGCQVNNPPEVKVGPRPSPLVVNPGGEVVLELEVTDPDGDEMEYAWTQIPPEPAGRFSNTRTRNPVWIAPDVEETTTFNLSVTVTDNEGGGVLGTTPGLVVRVR